MRALTVLQPWAWAIAAGFKRVENRDWMPGRWIARGTRIAIHAGKRAPELADLRFVERRVPAEAWRGSATQRVAGAVVAVAKVANVVEAAKDLPEDQRPWFVGRFGWVLEDVRRLAVPVACRGQQRLWTLAGPELFAVLEQLGEGRR